MSMHDLAIMMDFYNPRVTIEVLDVTSDPLITNERLLFNETLKTNPCVLMDNGSIKMR